jgi:glycosyltransferase involved in cell wall biosynthesis
MDPPVNVLHLATFDTHGGAAVAALRLVESLRRREHSARLLVREKVTSLPYVDALGGGAAAPLTDPAVTQLTWQFSQRGRPAGRTTAFSTDLPTYDLAGHPAVRAADVLHLHWVTGFVSAYEVRRLQNLGKPVIWTLHDQFPFTGGCHYTQRCRGYMKACARCPELIADAQPLANLTLAEKRSLIDPSRLLVAAPSRWMAESARRSKLFRRSRIEVVPYGIDVDARGTISRDRARATLGIPADALVVFSASANHRDPRKGHAHLVEALRLARASAPAALRRRWLVLTAGEADVAADVGGVPCRALGALAADDPQLAMAYRAADVFVLPSLEDNLPNTVLEAMAAATPVVAYDAGGIPDAVADGVNGHLVRRGNVKGLAKSLLHLLGDEALRRQMGGAALTAARSRFDSAIQSKAYERIYAAELERADRRRARPRRLRTMAQDRWADAGRLRTLLTDRRASRLLNALLRQEIDDLQRTIASRGGEIRDHQTTIARQLDERGSLLDAHAGALADLRRQMTALDGQMAAARHEHQREASELQGEIASRGGEIRDLRKALGDAQQASARRKEVLGHLMRAQPRRRLGDRLAVGIFGVGDSGRRVLEAAVLLDCKIAWLADNNADLQGHTDLGCAVMRPDALPGLSFDALIVASAHRDAIRQQLIQLGIDPERILAPDVTKTDAELFDELRRLLEPRRHATAQPHSPSARSSTGRS